MELKNKIKQIILRIICGLFLILTIFLSIIAVVYTVNGGTPDLFGTSIYLVNTDAFDCLENGTALIAKRVHYSEIQPGNIVIFSLENNKPALAEIHSGELSDGVYSFNAITENGDSVILSQSQVVAKGISYSAFWGSVISFAVSPIGTLIIAIVPCFVIIIIELTKFIRKTLPEPEIDTVKKQLEIPTYTPESGKAAAVAAYSASRGSQLDDSIGLYDAQVHRNPSIERTDVLEISQQEEPLFLGPKRKPIAVQQRNETMPLSQKKLNEAIAAAKAERELEEANRKRAETIRDIQQKRGAIISAEKEQEELLKTMQQTVKTQEDDDIKPSKKDDTFVPEFKPRQRTGVLNRPDDENIKQYTPHKSHNQAHSTSSIPRLDVLLNDENEGDSYNIDDILAGLERK